MASFRAADDLGCDWVECDCRRASDGVVVLAHGEAVSDTDGRLCRIERFTAAQLAALDLGKGEGVPMLRELADWSGGRVGIMADVKEDGIELEIGNALAEIPADRKIVPGASKRARARFREAFPDLPLSTTLDK